MNRCVHLHKRTRISAAIACLLSLSVSPVLLADSKTNDDDLHAIYQNAFGHQRALPPQLKLNLAISGTELGELISYSDGKQITHVGTKALLSNLKKVLKEQPYAEIQAAAEQTPNRFPLASLQTWHIRHHYDANHLQLKLMIPVERRIPTPLNLSRKRQPLFSEDELSQPAKLSGYTNFNSRIEHDHYRNRTRQRLQAESVLNYDGFVLENQATWQNAQSTGTEAQTRRDYTRLRVDDPSNMHRYTVGDISTVGINLQNGIQLGGISLHKYTGMDPYRVNHTGTAQTFTLEENSEVKIYLNDALQAIRQLDEGIYSLNDLNLSTGVNTVKLEITNENGDTKEQAFTLSNEYGLLGHNQAEYGVDIGLPRYRQNNETHYDDQTPVASGYYQQGINGSTTIGISGMSDGNSTQAGVNFSRSSAIGKINTIVSASKQDDDVGLGSKLEYRYRSGNKAMPNLFASAEHYNKDFSSLRYNAVNHELSKSTQNTENRVYASIGKKLGDDVYVTLAGQYETRYGTDTSRKSANLNVRTQLGKGKSVSALVRYQNYQQRDEVSGQVNLHLPIASNEIGARYKTFDTRYNSLDESIMSRFSVSPDNSVGPGSLSGSIAHQKRHNTHSLSGNMSYRDTRFEAALSHQASKYEGSDTRHNTRLKFNTAIAFADDTVALSKPIRNSFAIVKAPQAHGDAAAKAIAVSKGSHSFQRSKGKALPDNYQAVIGRRGSPAVIELNDYYQTSVNVDSTALPIGSDPDASEFKLHPTYHQGYVLHAGGVAGVIIDGVLVDEDANILSLKGGQLIPTGTSIRSHQTIAFFSNQAGKFRLPSVPPGRYKLELFDYDVPTLPVITVPNRIGEKHDFGQLMFPVKD